jgi:hypothetical protein
MAAANESQGLKIAVAAFVTLTVILAVTSYFLYTAYSKSEAQLEAAQEKLRTAQKAQNDAVNQYDEFRKLAGVRAEEFDPAKAEATTYFKKTDERIGNLANTVSAAIKQAQEAGATAAELEDAKAKVQTIVTSYRNEPNKNFISTEDRLVELLENVALLSTQLSANYTGVRRGLESSNTNAKQQIDVQAKAASDNKSDLEAEHNKHESERQSLLTKVDQLQTDNDKKATEIANTQTQLRQLKEETDRKLELANTIIREYRDLNEKTENVLDQPDGYVTYVDHDRREVHLNITRRQGARPQMKMTIFEAGSPGIPTEKPKGNIELIQVGDTYSIARIAKTNSTIDPIRIGDIVYSAAWSPNEPMRFALIGKIDVNRDGKDDRADLKRMIEEAGGVVDYDLPPPEYGKESGKLTARIAWYVIDDRMPLREVYQQRSDVTLAQQSEFQKRYGQAIKDARLEGIRPMPVGRLLAYLGYEMGTPIVGRAEAVNSPAMRRLVEPKKKVEPKAESEATKAEAAKPDAATTPAPEEPKDQPKADEKPQ